MLGISRRVECARQSRAFRPGPSSVGRVEAGDFQRQSPIPDAATERSERLIADRLDALEAERVFQRALELEAEAIEQPHMFTNEQLESIAAEIDMDVIFVRQALGEIRLSPGERSRLDRFILPDHIMEVESIEGLSRDELDELVGRYMREREGLIEAGRLPDGASWHVDRRLASRMRTTVTSGGNRVSRLAGDDIAHRVYSMGEDEHVVALQSQALRPLMIAKLAMAAAAGLFVVGSLGTLAIGFLPLIPTLGLVLFSSLALATGGVVTARRWAHKIGRAFRQSLTHLAERAKPSGRTRRFPWGRK